MDIEEYVEIEDEIPSKPMLINFQDMEVLFMSRQQVPFHQRPNPWYMHPLPPDKRGSTPKIRISLERVYKDWNSVYLGVNISIKVYEAYDKWLVDKEMEKVLGGCTDEKG